MEENSRSMRINKYLEESIEGLVYVNNLRIDAENMYGEIADDKLFALVDELRFKCGKINKGPDFWILN
jgi:hypothetical protein